MDAGSPIILRDYDRPMPCHSVINLCSFLGSNSANHKDYITLWKNSVAKGGKREMISCMTHTNSFTSVFP